MLGGTRVDIGGSSVGRDEGRQGMRVDTGGSSVGRYEGRQVA